MKAFTTRPCLIRCPVSGLLHRPFIAHPQHPQKAKAQLRQQRCIAVPAAGPADVGTTPPKAAPSTSAPGASGRSTYKPDSFREIVQDAVGAILKAVEKGDNRLEVEFPPLPVSNEAYKSGSDSYVDSNAQLAVAGARFLAAQGRRVHVIMPDQVEYARTYRMFKASMQLSPGVTLGHLGEAQEIGGPVGAVLGFINGAGSAPPSAAAAAQADTFMFINLYAVDLGRVEKYVNEIVKDRVAVLWNLELDALRGDLGMMGFPTKDMHHSFLARFRPAFYLRPRDYSKSVSVAPFIINYSGALFREFPGPWQIMLRQDNGEYACIAERAQRYNLGDAKEEMLTAMGLNTEEEGSTMAFLRRGYKTSTWWEDALADDKSPNWHE